MDETGGVDEANGQAVEVTSHSDRLPFLRLSRTAWLGVVLCGVLLVLLISARITVWRVDIYTHEITGSQRFEKRSWLWGESPPVVEDSPLAGQLPVPVEGAEDVWQFGYPEGRWVQTRVRFHNMWWAVIRDEQVQHLPIQSLSLPQMASFARWAPLPRRLRFVQIMQSGETDEQIDEVREVAETDWPQFPGAADHQPTRYD